MRDAEKGYNGIDPFEMSYFRTIFNCTTTFFVMKFKYGKNCTEVPKKLYFYLFLRSMFGMAGFVALTFSIAYLPISIFNTILNTGPFYVSILSYYILGEVLKKREFGGMVICFLAVCLLVNTKTDGNEVSRPFDKYYFFGVILAIFEAFSVAVVFVITRKMKEVHFTVMQINYTGIASAT